METIKVENVKEAIDVIYQFREQAESNDIWTPEYKIGQRNAYDACIGILENLIVRRQRNES
jgi:hypothetical protein